MTTRIQNLDYRSSAQQQGEIASVDGHPVNLFVSPSADLAAKSGEGWDSDSWFVTSHLTTARGPLDLLVHYMRVVPTPGRPGVVQVMASVLDPRTGRYVSEEKDFPDEECSLSTERCAVITPIGAVIGDARELQVTGTWSNAGVSCDLTISQAGPALANGGTGLWPMMRGLTYHYALPTMTTTGTVTIDGETFEVSGNSWLDRQWATTNGLFDGPPARWVWFGIALDDGTRLSCWDLLEGDRRHHFATIAHANGAHEVVTLDPTVELASREWTSPQTGRVYPTSWVARMPQIDTELVLTPDVVEQEFVSPNPTLHKYEASTAVTGTLHGRPVTGWATIELVGNWV